MVLTAASILHMSAKGQQPDSLRHQRSNYYGFAYLLTGGGVSIGAAMPPGSLTVSFPYTVTTRSGVRFDSVFRSKSIRPFPRVMAFTIPIGLEAGDPKQFATVRFLMTFGGSAIGPNFSFGYGRNIFLRDPHNDHKRASIVLKPFVRLAFSTYRGYDYTDAFNLGSLDNRKKTISALGAISDTTYTSSDRHPETYPVKTLDIFFGQDEWQVTPGVIISNNPFRHYFHWQLEMSYNYHLSEKGQVFLVQNASENKIKSVSLNDKRLAATFNDQPVTSTPFHIDFFYLGLMAGVSF